MKKIYITPKKGKVAKYPLFKDDNSLISYIVGELNDPLLMSKQMLSLELDELEFRSAIIELRSLILAPKNPDGMFIRGIRGVVETGSFVKPTWSPFVGFCHPAFLKFENWDDKNARCVRIDDDNKIDLDKIFAEYSMNYQTTDFQY